MFWLSTPSVNPARAFPRGKMPRSAIWQHGWWAYWTNWESHTHVVGLSEQAIRRATRLVPGLKAEIVPNANHCAQYATPELVNQKILDFLAK